MATTPNFNWSTPDNTGLVKSGALDIRTLGNAIDASMVDLKGGTTGQVLAKQTNTDMDFTWTTPATATSKVVQIIYGSTATGTGSASTTFADTGLSATITPTSSSNKILVMFNQNGCHKYNANTRLQIRLVRGSTTILNSESFAGNNDGSGGNAFGSSSAVYLDSPATTSATTYKTQFANQAGAGTVYVNDQTSPGSTSTMVLMEVTP
jgi:hypothetical protein